LNLIILKNKKIASGVLYFKNKTQYIQNEYIITKKLIYQFKYNNRPIQMYIKKITIYYTC